MSKLVDAIWGWIEWALMSPLQRWDFKFYEETTRFRERYGAADEG